MKWLVGLVVVLAALAALAWYALLDATPPAASSGQFDLAAYRELVAADAPETLPGEVRIAFVGESQAPHFAAEAGAFTGNRTFSYNSLQLVGPDGATLIDGAVDRDTLNQMSDGDGSFDEQAYDRVLNAAEQASHILITHEHLDHVMAFARHPHPEAIAARLDLTRAQLDGLPQHAPNGQLPPALAAIFPQDFSTPTRIAPGIVAHAAPGHSTGTIIIFARTPEREYLFIGDIAWLMGSVENLRGRPRFITWIMPGVDPDRPAVLRQLRELHDMTASNPELIIVPAHDDTHLRGLVANGALIEGFAALAPE
jgi:glyoxylase-like metal-dependent hydrolase (beta-lactamase superfamily II)